MGPPLTHISTGVSGQITQCLRYLGDAIKEIVLHLKSIFQSDALFVCKQRVTSNKNVRIQSDEAMFAAYLNFTPQNYALTSLTMNRITYLL